MGEGGGESEIVVSARESSVGTWTFVTGMVTLLTLANEDHYSLLRPLYKAVWSKRHQIDAPQQAGREELCFLSDKKSTW